tara:strand:- start:1581 stop:1721 length:141 start_codon:yes stop_codon:yes gene_type:complete
MMLPGWRLDISCAKRREVILDGSTAASMRQMFAAETSSRQPGSIVH